MESQTSLADNPLDLLARCSSGVVTIFDTQPPPVGHSFPLGPKKWVQLKPGIGDQFVFSGRDLEKLSQSFDDVLQNLDQYKDPTLDSIQALKERLSLAVVVEDETQKEGYLKNQSIISSVPFFSQIGQPPSQMNEAPEAITEALYEIGRRCIFKHQKDQFPPPQELLKRVMKCSPLILGVQHVPTVHLYQEIFNREIGLIRNEIRRMNESKGFVWKVKYQPDSSGHETGYKEVYLVGSLHSGDPDFNLSPQLFDLICDGSELAVEVNTIHEETKTEIQRLTQQKLLRSQKAQKLFQHHQSLQSSIVQSLDLSSDKGVEEQLIRAANDRSVLVTNLETPDEHLDYLFASLQPPQIMDPGLAVRTGVMQLGCFLLGYKEKNSGFFEEEVLRQGTPSYMFTNRTKTMADRLFEKISNPADTTNRLIACIGALHFFGPKNLRELLEKKGCSIEPVDFSS